MKAVSETFWIACVIGRVLAADEADDVLGLGEDRVGNRVCALGTVGKYTVDLLGMSEQLPHLSADRHEFSAGKLGEGFLELRERRVTEITQHLNFICVGKRGKNADEIVCFWPRIKSFGL